MVRSSRLVVWMLLASCGNQLPPPATHDAAEPDAAATQDAVDAAAPDALVVGPNQLLVRVRGPEAGYSINSTGSASISARGDIDVVLDAAPDMTVWVEQSRDNGIEAWHDSRYIVGAEAGDVLTFDFTVPNEIEITPPWGYLFSVGAPCSRGIRRHNSYIWLRADTACAYALGPTTVYLAGYENGGTNRYIADLAVPNVDLLQPGELVIQQPWTAATGALPVTLHGINAGTTYHVMQIPLQGNAPLLAIGDPIYFNAGAPADDTFDVHVAPPIGDGFVYGVEWIGKTYLVGLAAPPASFSVDTSALLQPVVITRTGSDRTWTGGDGADAFVVTASHDRDPTYPTVHYTLTALLPAEVRAWSGTWDQFSVEAIESNVASYRDFRQLAFTHPRVPVWGMSLWTPVVGETVRTALAR